MTSASRKDCIFRQLEENPEDMPPSMARVMGAFTGDESETLSETAKILAATETSVCDVEGCRISTGGLMRYVLSAGKGMPRQRLDKAVAPSCAILDIPHAAEEVLVSNVYPDGPRVQD